MIYVLEGEGYVTSPEIDLARRMGAELEIVSGVVVPAKENGTRPFFSISQWVNQQRKTFNKKDHPFENAFYKLIGNNIYGKVAQGLKGQVTCLRYTDRQYTTAGTISYLRCICCCLCDGSG